MFSVILKFLVVVGLLIAGGFFLATGLGVTIPMISYKGLQAHNVPVGVTLLLAAIGIARYWKISKTEEHEETTTTTYGDGSSITTKSTTKITTHAENPSDFGGDKKL